VLAVVVATVRHRVEGGACFGDPIATAALALDLIAISGRQDSSVLTAAVASEAVLDMRWCARCRATLGGRVVVKFDAVESWPWWR
jgi:hypothetical protein